MILAIATRTENIPEEKPFDDRFYLTAYFKKIFDDMGIILFPLISDKKPCQSPPIWQAASYSRAAIRI